MSLFTVNNNIVNHQHFSSSDLHFYALTSFTVIILPNIKAWGTSYSHLRFKKHTFLYLQYLRMHAGRATGLFI